MGLSKVDLETLLSTSDIISLHIPNTTETANIINANAINKMKKGSFLINCARGGLVDESALYAALENNHLKGAALDVFEIEPAKENNLFKLESVLLAVAYMLQNEGGESFRSNLTLFGCGNNN